MKNQLHNLSSESEESHRLLDEAGIINREEVLNTNFPHSMFRYKVAVRNLSLPERIKLLITKLNAQQKNK